METNNQPKKKKIVMPFVISAAGAYSIFVILLVYGPRQRGYYNSWLRPRDAFELYDFSGLTDFGKTLATVIPIGAFVLMLYLLYNYMNKKKLKDSEDLK